MKKALAISSGALLALVPAVTYAQYTVNNISDVGTTIINIINQIVVPVLFAIAFIVFIWGVFQTFIAGATSEDKRKEGQSLMLWGLIGFFVMISVWGLVNILTGSFSLNNNLNGQVPTSQTQVGG